jgi:hypothetical protein
MRSVLDVDGETMMMRKGLKTMTRADAADRNAANQRLLLIMNHSVIFEKWTRRVIQVNVKSQRIWIPQVSPFGRSRTFFEGSAKGLLCCGISCARLLPP